MLKVNFNENHSIAILEPIDELSENDFIAASRIIDPYIEKSGILTGLIIYTKEFPKWDSFSALLKHLTFIKEHHKKISHVAFVTDSFVGEVAENVASHFIKAKIKNFDFSEMEKAKKWILNDNYIANGLLFGVERINDNLFLKLKAIGTLTHEDYEKINPMLDLALTGIKDPKIDVLVDISELEGWDLEAAWDDLKLGLKYGNSFNKIAIYGEKSWVKFASKISSWFIDGQIKEFKSLEEAIKWIKP